MRENNGNKKDGKVKTFFRRLLKELDRKMEEKAKTKPCCCNPSDKEKNSCCS